MLKLCPAVDEVWFWDLLERGPLPTSKRSKAKIRNLLQAHRIRRWDAPAKTSSGKECVLGYDPIHGVAPFWGKWHWNDRLGWIGLRKVACELQVFGRQAGSAL